MIFDNSDTKKTQFEMALEMREEQKRLDRILATQQIESDFPEDNDNGSENSAFELRLFKEKGIRKTYANDLVAAFIQMGVIKKPMQCEKCAGLRKLVAHHDDYFKPLDILWLCITCHRNRHIRLKNDDLDPCVNFCRKILESPEGDNYLNRLHQFYSQVAELSSELFGTDFLEQHDISESSVKLSLSFPDSERRKNL